MNVLTNTSVPSQDPYNRYVLEEMHGGITHKEFQNKIKKSYDVLHYIEDNEHSYSSVADWMSTHGYEKQAQRCKVMHEKLASGGNIMRRGVYVPKDYIGAFVGAYPHMLTHPDADRFLNVRECLDIMKMPRDFQLQGGTKNLNMICQNVPVTTATDMASNVKKFLDGKAELIETDFAIQDNKARTFDYDKPVNTLESFL